tara:strand:- start:4818 stop:6068 length:1251 start_codon:yes stop_codon:yes gene_type:complete
MNILFVHQNFPGQFKYLAPALVKEGFNVSSLSFNKHKLLANINQHTYKVSKGSADDIHDWAIDFETKVIRAEACFNKAMLMASDGYYPDLIIAHHGWGESLFLKTVWPKAKLAIYCEFFYHPTKYDCCFDPEFPSKKNNECRVTLKNINNFLHFEIADYAISPTYWQASTFPQPFREKIKVIHDGIDTEAIKPNNNICLTLNESLKLSSDDEIITFVNRNLEPYRGYHIFMRSLPLILKERPKARVLLIGGDGVSYGAKPPMSTWKDIFYQEIYPQLSKDELERIHFLGFISYKQFVAVLQLSKVHVYLTYPFVLSWSLLESMSAGCAIVASSTDPLLEIISDAKNGLLVDFFDHKSLAGKVCKLLDDNELRNLLGKNAREFVVRNYDRKTICIPNQINWINSIFDGIKNNSKLSK